MELDILNKENLDSSITNEQFSGFDAINTPIKRGMYVCPKVVMSPYYDYNYSNYSGSVLFNRANLLPKTSVGSTATAIPTSVPNTSAGATLGSNTALSTPNVSVGTTLESPTLSTPVGSSGTNFNTPTPTLSVPFSPTNPLHGGVTNPLSQSYTPTSLVTNTSTNTPSPVNTIPMGGGMSMGGGGGALPLSNSEESVAEEPAVSSGMRVAGINKKGLSKEAKIGLLVLVAIGGYFAYKKGLLSKI